MNHMQLLLSKSKRNKLLRRMFYKTDDTYIALNYTKQKMVL